MEPTRSSKKSGDGVIVVQALVEIGGVGQVSHLSSAKLNGSQKVRILAGTQGILLPSDHSDENQEVMFNYGNTGTARVKVSPGEVAQI